MTLNVIGCSIPRTLFFSAGPQEKEEGGAFPSWSEREGDGAGYCLGGAWGLFHSWRNWGSEEGRALLEGCTGRLGPQTNSPEDPHITSEVTSHHLYHSMSVIGESLGSALTWGQELGKDENTRR